MTGRLLQIVPTRSRPQNIAKVVEAWDATGAFDHADLYFVIDDDDPARDEYWKAYGDVRRMMEASALRTRRLAKLWMHEAVKWQPLVPKLNDFTESCMRWIGNYCGHTAYGFAGDDHLPRTVGWAKKFLDRLEILDTEHGGGIVYGNDGYQGERLATSWAMSASIVKALGGRQVPAPVEHLYCDNAVMDLGRRLGVLRYLPDVMIEHMHPSARKAKTDAQYDTVNGTLQYQRDSSAYLAWKLVQGGDSRVPSLAADVQRARGAFNEKNTTTGEK